jgi:hypothetical protein
VVSSGDVIVTRVDEFHHVGGAWKMEEFMNQPGYDWTHLWPDFLWVPYQVIKADNYPDNDKEYYGNPYVDIDWVRKHLLVPGGRDTDDYRGTPCPVADAPKLPPPSPSPSPSASARPSPEPTETPSPRPSPSRSVRPSPSARPG